MARLVLALLLAAALAPTVHAREVKAKATHGALGYHAASGNAGYAVDRASSREARLEALRQCGHPQCEVVATLRGGDCAPVAKGPKKAVAQKGVTRPEAEAKALRRCGEGCEIALWACTR